MDSFIKKNSNLDFYKAICGHYLTTAEIIYHLPDHPLLLQTYIWQEYDFPPKYPELQSFLAFWEKNIEGRIHKVRVMVADSLRSHSFLMPAASLEIH
jgi:uncharacterized protein Usg